MSFIPFTEKNLGRKILKFARIRNRIKMKRIRNTDNFDQSPTQLNCI